MKEWVIFIIFLILGILCYIQGIDHFYGQLVVNHLDYIDKTREYCDNGELPDDVCEEFYYIYNKYDNHLPDAFTGFYNVIINSDIAIYTLSFFICFASIYSISREFKGKFIYNYLQRSDYKNYIKRIFKRAYKYTLYYIPLFLLIFIICVILSKGIFDMSLALEGIYDTWPSLFMENVIINSIFYFSFFLLVNGILISLSLLFVKKFVNPIICATASLLSFFVLSVSFEAVFAYINKHFGYDWYTYFDLINIRFSLNTSNVMWIQFLILFIIFIIFFILTCLTYRKKEKFVIGLEKYGKE